MMINLSFITVNSIYYRHGHHIHGLTHFEGFTSYIDKEGLPFKVMLLLEQSLAQFSKR